MNLHAVASGIVSAVNPQVSAVVQISSGPSATAADGSRTPTFETPGAFTAAIADDQMTVSASSLGKLLPGQRIDGAGVAANTTIFEQVSGTVGGAGVYQIVPGGQTVSSEAMTSSLSVPAQVQALSGRDLRQVEGLNLQGTLRACYFYGQVEAIVRATRRGGSLVTLPDGSNWLVASMLEQWPDWCKVVLVLQNP